MTTATCQMAELASSLEAAFSGVQTQIQEFPSGGVMLDVRRVGGRVFVMSYAPQRGFGVDEARADDGFTTDYRFTCAEFDRAADRLRALVGDKTDQPPSGAVVSLGLLVLYSANVEASKQFYRSLGLNFESEKHGKGPPHYAAKLGATVFEIYPRSQRSASAASRLGFRLPFVERVLDDLRKQSFSIVSELTMTPWGKRAIVKDPDGNFVELVEA